MNKLVRRFRRLPAPIRKRLARQEGYTLPELLLVVAIMSGVILALGSAFVVSTQTSVEARTQLNESNDLSLLNAYFEGDVASASSVRGKGSVPAGVCGELSPGVAVPGDAVVALLEWSETPIAGGPTTSKLAFYYRETSFGDKLFRRFCENGVPTSTALLMRNVGWATITCLPDGQCLGPAPARAQLYVTTASGFNHMINAMPRATKAAQYLDAAPSVKSILPLDPPVTNLDKVRWLVTFSEPVTKVNAPIPGNAGDFQLNPSTNGKNIVVSPFPNQLSTTWTVTADTNTTAGDLSLRLIKDGTIVDFPMSTQLAGTFPVASLSPYTIDKIPPTVSVTRAAANPPSLPIHFTATFSEPIRGLDPAAVLRGGTALEGNVVSATQIGTSNSWDIVVDGVTDGTVNVAIPAGAVRDIAGNANTASVVNAGNTSTFEGSAPGVKSFVRNDPDPNNTGSVSWTVTFSEVVTGVDAADFALVKLNGLGGTPTFSVTGSGAVYKITATTGSGTGGLRLDLNDNDTIRDLATPPKPLYGAGTGVTNGPAYGIDKVAPTVTLVKKAGQPDPTTAPSASFTATFSEPVVGFDAGDVARGGTAGGGAVAVSGTGPVYDVTVSGLTSDGTVTVQIGAGRVTDPAGNAGTASATASVVYDNGSPTVVSLERAEASPHKGPSARWTVTFSEPVNGVDAGDFVAVAGGGLGGTPSVSAVSGGGTIYEVTATTGSGNGTLGLNLVDNDTIVDQLSKKLGGTGTSGAANGSFTGAVYDVDNKPTVTAVVLRNKTGGTAGRIEQGDQLVVTFSERVSGFCEDWATTDVNRSVNDVTVTLDNVSNNVLTVNSSGCSTDNWGSFNLGGDYLSGSTDRTFGASGTRSAIQWDAATNTLTITLGTPSSTSGFNTVSGGTNATYTADADLRDATNQAPAPASLSTGTRVQF